MGEDLVLYRDGSGTYGLVDRHCPHRRADLSYGLVEDCGLRCNYHGWAFDEGGRCIDQPFEETAHPEAHYKDRVTHQVRTRSRPRPGLLWAYMGPQPAPLCPTWEPFTWENGFVQIVFSEVPCNWLQCQENCIDPVHFEWLHSNWAPALKNAREGKHIADAPARSASTSSTTASSTAASWRAARKPTSCGPSAASACGRTACSPATTSSGACRSTTRTR